MRTVLECPRATDLDWAVVIADAAVHAGLVPHEALLEAASTVRRVRGAGRIRALAGLVSSHSESPGPTLLRLRLIRMGIVAQEQVPMPWIQGSPRADFLIDQHLVVEFDGRSKYTIAQDPESAHWAEKKRHDRIVEDGNVVLHITWDQFRDERALERRVRAARATAGRFRSA